MFITTDHRLQVDLQRAFHPKAVAIVSVSGDDVNPPPGYTGLKILRLLRAAGFEGRLYPINPKAMPWLVSGTCQSRRCFAIGLSI